MGGDEIAKDGKEGEWTRSPDDHRWTMWRPSPATRLPSLPPPPSPRCPALHCRCCTVNTTPDRSSPSPKHLGSSKVARAYAWSTVTGSAPADYRRSMSKKVVDSFIKLQQLNAKQCGVQIRARPGMRGCGEGRLASGVDE